MGYLDELFTLAGRRALVTGGSSGIGLAMGQALRAAGADVTLVGRDESRLAATGLPWIAADLGERAGVRATVERAGAAGPVDILVNSAGVNLRPPLGELTAAEWDRTVELNLTAPFLLGQAFGPAMAARGWGRIINIASQQSVRAFGHSGVYGVSKAGLTALTRSQAEAWSKSGVCCNAIAPGFVRTPLTTAVFSDPARAEAMAARTMVGRNGELDDFAGITVFLASAASGYVTGQTIFVDGGFSST
jgi:NAD(P)-dependent dehydrogenase (short-subunit alcohol dehydrogenase family)